MATEFNTGADATLNAAVKSRYEANSNTNAFTDAEQTKLAGVATGATANSSDATLLDRANHTGQDEIADVNGLQAALDAKAASAGATLTGVTATASDNFIMAYHGGVYVRNNTGSTITAMTPVKMAGAWGTLAPTVAPADAANGDEAIGIAREDIPTASYGVIYDRGMIWPDLDTSAWADGTLLWLAAGGGLTSTKPTTSGYSEQPMAYVSRSHATLGRLHVICAPKVRAPVHSALLNAAQTFTKAQGVAVVTLTDGATINTDASLSNQFKVTLGGNRTMAAPTNLVEGRVYQWEIKQDGTGSRTVTWNSIFKWEGGTAPTLGTTANSSDIITARYNGTNLHAIKAGSFAA